MGTNRRKAGRTLDHNWKLWATTGGPPNGGKVPMPRILPTAGNKAGDNLGDTVRTRVSQRKPHSGKQGWGHSEKQSGNRHTGRHTAKGDTIDDILGHADEDTM